MQDFTDLETALAELRETAQEQYLTMMMFYKPWTVRAMIAEGFDFNNSTYYKRLHAGHKKVGDHMDKLLQDKQLKAA